MNEKTVTIEPLINQFIIGPHTPEHLSNWDSISLDETLILSSHPTLNVEQASTIESSLTLIGHIFDPLAPSLNNTDILEQILKNSQNQEALFAAIDSLGGRWVLIYKTSAAFILLHDAMGLRQTLFTHVQSNKPLWIMSQPNLIADHLQLNVSDEANSFMQSYEFRKSKEYRWPGFSTAYKEIIRLLPNHYLDLNSREFHRFWPNKDILPIPYETAKQSIQTLLSGAITAFATRFECTLGLTAGLDSRLVLAASRSNANKLSSMTVRQGLMPDDHADLSIAETLGNTYLTSHTRVDALPYMSPKFSYAFKSHGFLTHDVYGGDAEAINIAFNRRYVVITGSGSEVGRLPYLDEENINISPSDPKSLTEAQNMGEHPFAIEQFEKWLEDSKNIHNIRLFDLFEWEQGHGVWLASTQLEFDMAWKDNFTPFNNRKLMETFMAVAEEYRTDPKQKLCIALIGDMWPELLETPINPHEVHQLSTVKRIKKRLKNLATGKW